MIQIADDSDSILQPRAVTTSENDQVWVEKMVTQEKKPEKIKKGNWQAENVGQQCVGVTVEQNLSLRCKQNSHSTEGGGSLKWSKDSYCIHSKRK